jgi:hypothetical protein
MNRLQSSNSAFNFNLRRYVQVCGAMESALADVGVKA